MWYKSKKPDWSSNHYSFLARTCQKKHAKTSPWISWCECKQTTNSPCFIKFFVLSCFINHCWSTNHRPTEIRHSTNRKSAQKWCHVSPVDPRSFRRTNLIRNGTVMEMVGDHGWRVPSSIESMIGGLTPGKCGHLLNSICHVSYRVNEGTFWLLSLEVSPQNRRCWTRTTCHTKMVVISPILSGSLGVWFGSRLKTWPPRQRGRESLWDHAAPGPWQTTSTLKSSGPRNHWVHWFVSVSK